MKLFFSYIFLSLNRDIFNRGSEKLYHGELFSENVAFIQFSQR